MTMTVRPEKTVFAASQLIGSDFAEVAALGIRTIADNRPVANHCVTDDSFCLEELREFNVDHAIERTACHPMRVVKSLQIYCQPVRTATFQHEFETEKSGFP